MPRRLPLALRISLALHEHRAVRDERDSHRSAGRRTVVGVAGLTAALLVASAASYTVQRGDTLGGIAGRSGTSVADIAAANGISDPNLIRIGQVLTIPGTGAASGATSSTTTSSTATSSGNRTHVVQPGESLSAIARRYGVSIAELVTANGMSDPNHIMVGSRLRIDGGAPAGAALGTAPVVPGVASGAAGSYTVRQGDTLGAIARSRGVSTADLAAANGITNANLIRVGQVLAVPGGWTCPVPNTTRFVDDFGAPRAEGRFHEGTDLFAPHGSAVLAPVGGSITTLEGRIGGKQFRLQGDDGFLYIGSHMSAFGTTGGRVVAGELIGQVGDTGSARGTSPHLHFEIHPTGTLAINPYPTLLAACR